MLLQQKVKTDNLKKALGNRFRATGEYADLVFGKGDQKGGEGDQ